MAIQLFITNCSSLHFIQSYKPCKVIKSLIREVLMQKYQKKKNWCIMEQFVLLSKLISNIVYVNNLLSVSLFHKFTKIKHFKSQTKEYKEFIQINNSLMTCI